LFDIDYLAHLSDAQSQVHPRGAANAQDHAALRHRLKTGALSADLVLPRLQIGEAVTTRAVRRGLARAPRASVPRADSHIGKDASV
jgi:hypothetical protein